VADLFIPKNSQYFTTEKKYVPGEAARKNNYFSPGVYP
jgi:hypothetical protein